MKYLERKTNDIITILTIKNGKAYLSNGDIIKENALHNNVNYVKIMESSLDNDINNINLEKKKKTQYNMKENKDINLEGIISDDASAARYASLVNNRGTQIGSIDDDIIYEDMSTNDHAIRGGSATARSIFDLRSPSIKSAPGYVNNNDYSSREQERSLELSRNNALLEKYSDEEYVGVSSQPRQQVQMQPMQSPINDMFRKAKRRLDFTYILNKTSKLPRVDFIEMMEDSYEESIVNYLAEEIFDNIIQSRDLIIRDIKRQIYDILPNLEMEEEIVENIDNNNDLTKSDKSVLTSEVDTRLVDEINEIKNDVFGTDITTIDDDSDDDYIEYL